MRLNYFCRQWPNHDDVIWLTPRPTQVVLWKLKLYQPYLYAEARLHQQNTVFKKFHHSVVWSVSHFISARRRRDRKKPTGVNLFSTEWIPLEDQRVPKLRGSSVRICLTHVAHQGTCRRCMRNVFSLLSQCVNVVSRWVSSPVIVSSII
jgi:hypothetical protein